MKEKFNLNNPIFIVGHARGGTTLLGSIINAHSKVGPKNFNKNLLDTEKLKDYQKHLAFSEKLEQKDIWFKYFKGEDCFTHMGMEIYEDTLKLSKDDIESLIEDLTENFKEERFISKAPTNSFRIKPLLQIFPNCKIVVVLRNGEEVVASWGKRPYGFGKNVNWGKLKIRKLSYYKGINIFTKKWMDVIKVIEEVKHENNVFIVTYEDLVSNTQLTLKKIINFLDLPHEHYLDEIYLKKDENKWKLGIPLFYRYYLKRKVKKGNQRIIRLKNAI